MKRKGKYYLLAAFAALAVTVCVGGYSAWQYFWGGAVARDAVVLVPTGSDFDRLTAVWTRPFVRDVTSSTRG